MLSNQQLESVIASNTGCPAKVVSTSPASGGCINECTFVQLQDKRSYFIKTNRQGMFQAERDGLAALRNTQTIRVPQVIAIGETSDSQHFLILETVETGKHSSSFDKNLGEQLAQMHRAGRSDSFGFLADNFIGSTPQMNPSENNWSKFWWNCRMEPQFQMARQNGFGDSFDSLLPRFKQAVNDLLGNHHPLPCLIHGDLWSGNVLCDQTGQPVLIDPAVYYADREAEFGMTTLFGDWGPAFYNAYQATWPMPDGWQQRVELYRLYHLLNHLNLFGSSYLAGCLAIIKKHL